MDRYLSGYARRWIGGRGPLRGLHRDHRTHAEQVSLWHGDRQYHRMLSDRHRDAVLSGIAARRPNWRLLLVTGVLGGYTTFSSFMWEAFQASSVGDRAIALANVLVSVVVGFLAVWCGTLHYAEVTIGRTPKT